MSEIMFDVVVSVVGICAFVITLYAVPYLYELQKDVRFSRLFEVVCTAVRAAEQTIKEKGKGADKKIKVMDAVREYVQDNKLTVSDDSLSDMVEAVVYDMNRNK